MENFKYSITTEIYFGKGSLKELKNIAKLGSRILLVYGGGSIKRTGLYDKAMYILRSAGVKVFELSGVEPNPRIETVRLGQQLCVDNDIEVVLAIGGGSTIDCAKVVAASAFYKNDPWDLVMQPSLIEKALPIVSVLTLAATGSEMDESAVISHMEKKIKKGTYGKVLRPAFSILDPKNTFSVPENQTAAGTADIMSHIFESYFTNIKGAFLQKRMCEALLITCIKYGPIALKEPDNYEARANLMWASSLAINDLLSYGNDVAWSVHAMEHELSAYYDITHGVGLAILTPTWMSYVLNDHTVDDFFEYGIRVWNLDEKGNKWEVAKAAIRKTREFFVSLGIPSRLTEVGIGEEHILEMAENVKGRFKESYVPLTVQDVVEIYRRSL